MSGWYNRSKVSKTYIPPRTNWTPQLRACTPRYGREKFLLSAEYIMIIIL